MPLTGIHEFPQIYLEHFFADLGFQSVSDPYDEGGIMPIGMLR
jgi:predicted GNAT family N-acyltransferase